MSKEDALNIFESMCELKVSNNYDCSDIDLYDVYEIICAATRKQIPQKPIDNCCPVCRCSISDLDTGSLDGISRDNYCSFCGQRIDWE